MNPSSAPAPFPALPVNQLTPAPRKTRVCIASFDFVGPVRNGGVGTAFTSLGEALAAAGHEVTFLFLAGRWCENRTLDHWIAEYRSKGITFVPMPESGLRFETAWHIAKAYEAYLWLKEQNFDVVHFSEWKGPGYFSLLAKRQGLAFEHTLLCVHTHGPTLWHKLSNGEYVTSVDDIHMDYLECRSVQLAEVLVSPSQYLLRWMLERNWTLPEKTFVQPYVRPATARAPLPDADRVHRITELVFFGRLEVRKGLVLFCDALDQLKDDPQLRKASLSFLGKADKIGNRDSADFLADRAKHWPWKWQIISDRDQVGAMDYLQGNGRLAVLPSLVDNLPNTVLECLGAKVPFIASNAGGIPEMIAGADLEAVCFPLQARPFADRLRHVLLNGIRPATPAWDSQANEAVWVAWHENQLPSESSLLPSVSLDFSAANPLVSVCLSHWNRPHYLKQALASIEAMDYSNYEVVLVDDGSTQPEAVKFINELAPEFARRNWQLLRNAENRFPGAARNLAARHARGEYILFMDDDNCAKPHELSTFVKAAQKTGADILTCCLDTFTGTAAPHARLAPRSRWVFVGDDAATGAIRNCFGDTNSLIRREAFLALGGFHEDWGVGHEDWEFFAKAVLQGYKLEVVPEALAWYRLNAEEQTVNRKTPIHRNHLANIRPYLDAVPASLKNLVYLVQGQDLLLAHAAGAAKLVDPVEAKLAITWNAKIEAARMFAKLKQKAQAIDLLMEAVKTVEAGKRPVMLFEVLLTAGQEMQTLDKNRAEQLFRIALQLAKALKNESMQQAANKAMMAAAAGAKALLPTPSKTDVTASASVPAREVAAPSTALVSIIIPVFNNLTLTRVCLESLAKAKVAARFEIIVVDNASTDGTAEFLKIEAAAARVHVLTNSQNEGFAQACNFGAQAAHGSILLFLNNDTQVTNGWLDALLEIAQQPDVGAVGAKLLYADGRIQHAGIEFINGVPDHPHRHAAADLPAANRQRELDMVTGACLMTSRDVFIKLGGFDETFRNGVEDVDYCLRVRALGLKVIYEPKSVVFHHEGRSAGRFDHVNENLKIFFGRWTKAFDQQARFIVPTPPRVTTAQRSILLAAKPADAAKAVTVSWEGSFLDHGSLSHVNRALTAELRAFPEFQLQCVTTGSPASPGFEDWARQISAAAAPDTDITVRHAWPPNWKRPARGKLVVIQPWEFGSLPAEWVQQSQQVDEFWLPSEYVRRVYAESGVPTAKLFVVPNGVDPKKFNPRAAPMKLATAKKFKFLFVGGTIGRKGPDLLLQAYLKNFTAADDVCLVIKDFGGQSFYAGQTFEAQIRTAQSLPNAPEILYLNQELPPDGLPGLYTACDCLVLPYRGEGFGLPVLEAMAGGLPVIVTAGGATDDFVRDEFASRIPAVQKYFGDEVGGMKLAAKGWLLEPDLAALGREMRGVFANPEAAHERGKLASRHAHQFFSWKNAAAAAAQRIRELCRPAGPQRTEATPMKMPPVAFIGRLLEARECLRQKNLPGAWEATLAAIAKRPFHPEAFLLLAEIALAACDATSARRCAQRARDLATNWNLAKQFLKKNLKGNAKPDWLKLPEKGQARLSVCLIVKNEEKFLGQCLQSIAGLAQQIIVVDTGSADRSLEIAKTFGAETYMIPWQDDFSAARNAALEHATGDWILILDADEELPAEQHSPLLADMNKPSLLACRLPLVNLEHEADGQSFIPRLFRNAPGVFYTGRIHEQVFPSLMPYSKAWGLELGFGTAQLLHHGYTKQIVRDRNKIERNLALLRQAVAENPVDANLMMNFGLELVRSDDLAGGVEKYREAFRLMSAQNSAETAPELREALLTQFTCQLYKIRAHGEVVQVLNSPLARSAELTASLHFAHGLALFELKQFAAAAEQMRQCIALRHRPGLSPINTDVPTTAPEHCLALCLEKTGEVAGAEKAFLTALAGPGRQEEIKLDYVKFLAAVNRPVEAFHKLHELVAVNARNLAAWRTGGEIALGRPEFLEFARDWTGEAVRYVTEDFTISRQRAEVLLLSGETKAAAELWERLWNSERQPAILAALILCETLESQTKHGPDQTVDEAATSRAFIKWYQRLIAMRANKVVQRINQRLDGFSPTLPTAVGLLEKALAAPVTASQP